MYARIHIYFRRGYVAEKIKEEPQKMNLVFGLTNINHCDMFWACFRHLPGKTGKC